MKKKSIIIDDFHHKELMKISKVYGAKYGDFVQAMILYFKKTGINPLETANDNPAELIKVLDKRIVSFMRVQERDILKPMRNEAFTYSKDQNTNFNNLQGWVKDAIVKVNKFDEARSKKLSDGFKAILKDINRVEVEVKKQQEALHLICEYLDQKNKSGFKAKFNSIFKDAD
ncbi:BfmA/BtgA family mobilization protein [Mesonia aestuariivivens]|uniref:DUF3486 family protein n=1 Tax=Mesonia aestuariivivens TaxID=2796128 RepID=A0ABS6W269_9FLAO|nr:BfmA/BtgA family mobilization protein [Mesonia aestuariivivens]MBW2961956.1 hypothetical protein [Mesonia aestuariivivens]